MKQMSEIRNKHWIRLFGCLVLLWIVGCTQADVDDDILLPTLKEVDAGFNLNVLANHIPVTRSILFTADGTMESDSIGTRAATPLEEAQESKIASVWVGQYVGGKLLYAKYISSLTGNTLNIKLKHDREGSESHVWFIANMGDQGEVATETALKKLLLTYVSTETGLPQSNLCGMTGMWSGMVQEGGVKDIRVNLSRMVAKISFTYSIAGEGFTFTPNTVTLNSVPQKMQVDVPENQLVGMTYTDYTGIADRDGATMYWYLPENMAGIVSDGNAIDSEKKKIGMGVTNATYIELTGTAVQGGVTYNNVVFRFYPGDGMNNYNIERNYHYVMKVTLVGIDISDERITVNEIPPIEVDPGKMPAEKGGIKEVQITARPGQAWSFDLEEWLSAMIGGVVAGTGVTVSHQGPAMVTFQSVSANPKAEDRSVTFSVNVNGENQEITITQEGSALSKGSDVISLGAAEGSEGASSFTTTKGLPWLAALSGENWWNWADDNPAFSGDEATGTEQALKIKATASNPLASERSGKITVSAGASIAEIGYTGLKEEIVVKQAGSKVEGSSMEVNPEAANNQTSSFVATSGLDWVAKVTEGDWITLVGATSGSQTTGKAQNVTFNIAVNPSSTARSGEIVVRAGDEIGGPTGTIKVNQKASALTVSASPTMLAATKDAAGTLSFKGTSGLSFSITKPDWLTLTGTIPETMNGNEQNLGYKTSEVNLNGSERTATVMVKAGIMSKEVTIKQVGSILDVIGGTGIIAASGGTTTGSVTATDGLAWTISPATDNGITVNPTNGSGNARLEFSAKENNAAERTGTFIVTVTDSDPLRTATVTVTQAMKNIPVCIDNLQIQKSDPGTIAFADVASFCEDLNEEKHNDWRLPTKDELVIIYNNLASLEEYVGAGFVMLNDGGYNNKWFWSSDFYSKNRYVVNMITGRVSSSAAPTGGGYIRCVRDNY
ncbi:BACON domain-containing carbohydrate-binding protein [Parabacteroides gordonii]|mgnify:CR=1 FL=1|jgi:hypothetical protein|uniref:BACON domain-containing protein n=1 Tax=Parabacteroides gordonii TaxID=574930 RepID=UPI00241F3698|nr:BACON domain-containing carbohydrate-binding protein [Parabacteroides gordonii]